MKKLMPHERKEICKRFWRSEFQIVIRQLEKEFPKSRPYIRIGEGWWIVIDLGDSETPGWRAKDNHSARRALKRRAAELLGVPRFIIKLNARYSCMNIEGDHLVRRDSEGSEIGRHER